MAMAAAAATTTTTTKAAMIAFRVSLCLFRKHQTQQRDERQNLLASKPKNLFISRGASGCGFLGAVAPRLVRLAVPDTRNFVILMNGRVSCVCLESPKWSGDITVRGTCSGLDKRRARLTRLERVRRQQREREQLLD